MENLIYSKTDKPVCILHIGMPKTGSSSIQATLCNCTMDMDVEFVDLMGNGNSSHLIHNLCSEHPEWYYANAKEGFAAEQISEFSKPFFERLSDLLSKTHAKKVIISGEDICYLNEIELNRLKDFLMVFCDSIFVIGYVRPIISYMQSALQQVIKEGIARFEFPDYRLKFENFDHIFGKDSVILVRYDAKTLLNGDVVMDFCQRIGIKTNGENTVHSNKSLSLEAISLLYTYSKLGLGYGTGDKSIQEMDLLVESLFSFGDRKLSFSQKLTESILEKSYDDIQWMESRLGDSLIEPFADTEDSISSLDDLLTLSVNCADDLKKLLSIQIQQQPATPQRIAEWVNLLRVQLSMANTEENNHIYSAAQVQQANSTINKLNDILSVIFTTVIDSNSQETIIGLRNKVLQYLKPIFDKSANGGFSIDLFEDNYLYGWVVNKSDFSHKLSIALYCAEGKIGEGVADQFREDLVNKICDDGCCAFVVEVNPKIVDFGEKIIILVRDYNEYFCVNTSAIAGISQHRHT